MIEYRLRQVSDPMGSWVTLRATDPTEAITKVTGCMARDIQGFYRPRVGTERHAIRKGDSIQSWDVEETRFAPIVARLGLFAQIPHDDVFKAETVRQAVEDVVKVTGIPYKDAERLVRTWLITLDSPHYDSIGLHPEVGDLPQYLEPPERV